MKRKIYDKLLEWKRTRAGSTALMIDGARRVGKSWIAEKFAEQLHEPVVLHPKDVKTDKGVLYLPLYMAQLLVASCRD